MTLTPAVLLNNCVILTGTGTIYDCALKRKFPREALIESGASRLLWKIVQFKAQTARNSQAIAKVCNTEMGDFTPQNAVSRFDQSFLRQIKQNDGHWLDRLPWPSPAISSSQLRQWLATGTTRDIKKAEPFLPETVSAYIQSSGLYTREPLVES